ncbi:hypothetical protein P3T39_003453 [Kitasatospora sp. GP82]|nr:hypothetical protein [Kitasatospora sp. GP82]
MSDPVTAIAVLKARPGREDEVGAEARPVIEP